MDTCTLCDLPVEQPVGGPEGTFCCPGCRDVYRTLGDIDVDARRTREGDDDAETDIPEDAESAYLAVDGMHCSTCELFLESSAGEREGVYGAEASYAAEAIRIAYDPDRLDERDLPELVSGLGYTARSRDEEGGRETEYASRLLVGGIFGMMAMVWYGLFLYPTYFGFEPVVELGGFDGTYLYAQLAVLTAIVLLYTGRPILRGAYVSLRTRRPNVDLLVTIAALAAFGYSTGRLLVGASDLYYDVTIVVVLAVTVGSYYEEHIKRETTGLLADLTELRIDEATRETGETVPIDAVGPGDRLVVGPGDRVPIDGVVREGTAAVDEALVTGESLPEVKEPGDEVKGGTIVTDAPIVVEVGDTGESTLDRVVELLWDIQSSRPGAQRLADKLATVFVPLVVSVAVLLGVALLATGAPAQVALLTTLTVLIVSCPCALGLATPMAVASGLQSAADRGIVVTTNALFEVAGEVDTVVFDKTGTLTEGVTEVTSVSGIDTEPGTVLRRAAALEGYVEHPIAEAITRAVSDPVVEGSAVDTVETAARCVSGVVDGDEVLVGHPDRFEIRGWTVPEDAGSARQAIADSGEVPVFVGWEGAVRGVIGVGDRPRDDWEDITDRIAERARVVVLTGDDSAAADRFREHPAIDRVYAGVPPEAKAETVERLAAEGSVAMVGDGSNDAPALSAADVGISMGTGTKLASDAADAVVVDGGLGTVPAVFEVATRTNRRIKENLAWAFLYNGVAIPLAVTGILNPLFAAVAMATSSLLVVANSARSLSTDDTGEVPDGGRLGSDPNPGRSRPVMGD